MPDAYPVKGSLHFYTRLVAPAPAAGQIGTLQFGDISSGIFDDFIALDDIGALQAHFLSRRQAKEFLWRILHEVLPFDIDLPAEGHFAHSRRWVFGIVFRTQHFLAGLEI